MILVEAGLLNSEKQTKVMLTECWVSNNIREINNKPYEYSKSVCLFKVQQSTDSAVAGNPGGMSSFLGKPHGEGLG